MVSSIFLVSSVRRPWCLEDFLWEHESLFFDLIPSSNIICRSFATLSHTLRPSTQSEKPLHLSTSSTHWNDQGICSMGKSFILSLWPIYLPLSYSFGAWSCSYLSILTALVYPIVTYQSLSALSAMALSILLFHITPTVSAYSFVSTFLYIPIYQCLSGSCQKYEYIQLFALSNPLQRRQSVPFLHFFVGVPLFR